MTLLQIQYFQEIARTGSFTLAAQKLHTAQSGLSYSIQSLEKELGVPLFIRSNGKRVTLTGYGEAFLPHAERILTDLAEGRSTIERLRNPNSGVVTVAYSHANCSSLIALLFKSFYERHSYDEISVRFSVNQGETRIERHVAMGETDLAFSCTPSFEGVRSQPVARQELFLILPVGHRLAQAERVSLREVKDEPFVGYHQNWNLSNHVAGMFEQEGLLPNMLEYFPDWAATVNYVAMGLGLAVLPRFPMDSDYVSAVPIDHPGRFRNIYLHWTGSRMLPPPAEYVRRYCIDFFKNRNILF